MGNISAVLQKSWKDSISTVIKLSESIPSQTVANITDIYEYILSETQLIKELVRLIIGYIEFEPDVKGKIKYELGRWGKGELEFCRPCGIAINKNYLYISEIENRRVQIIDTEGNFIDFIGERGDKDGQFGLPRGLDIFESEIYIADEKNMKIQIFSVVDRKFIRNFKCGGRCYGVCVRNSCIYVSFGDFYIRVFTLGGKCVKIINCNDSYVIKPGFRYGTKQRELRFYGIYVYENELYVADVGHGIVLCLSTEGKYKYCIDGIINDGHPFTNPCGLYITERSIYIGDKTRIQCFDKLNYNRCVRGWNSDLFRNIGCLTFTSNNCYVADWGKNCIFSLE